jgi:hypothetical protein
MAKKILMTGGRAPYALSLVRALAKAGHKIFSAETVAFPILRFSRHVSKNFTLPPPKVDERQYVNLLKEIIFSEKIDLLFPTCEEIFYISKYKGEFSASCTVLIETFDKLLKLHNKWDFIQASKGHGFQVPETVLVKSQEDLRQSLEKTLNKVVLKPVFSRFASQIHFYAPSDPIPQISVSGDFPWVIQKHLQGDHFCTYGIAHEGILNAHAVYPSKYRWNNGTCVVFKSVEHPKIFKWVTDFVKKETFTGQIAFDFIECDQGLFPLECNPRATSGAHLFLNHEHFGECFFESRPLITPRNQQTYALKAYLFLKIFSQNGSAVWDLFKKTKGVLWDPLDKAPVFGQFVSSMEFLYLALRHRLNFVEATTYGIDFNG